MANFIIELGNSVLRKILKFFEGFKRYRFTLLEARIPSETEKNNRNGTWWDSEQQWFSRDTPPPCWLLSSSELIFELQALFLPPNNNF